MIIDFGEERGGRIDLNFHPEQHLDELEGVLDLEVPAGWTIGRLIKELYDAKLDLWFALNDVDDNGTVTPKWK